MTYEIGKRFRFSASHQLPGLREGHPCSRLHGHNYTVEVVIGTDALVTPGFVTDFAELAPLKEHIDSALDHRHLNDVLSVPPTSENLAAHLAHWFTENVGPGIPGRLLRVRVSETDTSWAEFTIEVPPR